MTAPITPDERAAMRETVATLDAAWEADDPTRPLVTEHATLALLAHVASAVPRLLDALDTAEAEVKRLTPPCDGGCSYGDGPDEECSAHGRPVAEVWGIVTEVQRQRDEARAEVARLREEAARPAPTQSDDLGQSYCPVHGDLLAGERSWRCANAAPGHERLAPPPVWDEDTVTEAVARAAHDAFCAAEEEDVPNTAWSRWDETSDHRRDLARRQVAAVLAVVREHLPVRPDREAVALTLCKEQDSIEHMEQTDDAPCSRCLAWADAVLLEWPGESRATVQAEALRNAAERLGPWTLASEVRQQLLDDADRLEKGADRG